MKKLSIFIYGIASYGLFFVTFLYAVGFLGNLWVPKSIDSAPTHSLGIALAINAGLLAIFAIQHSGMARPAFKRWLTRFIPAAAERSTYVLMSTVALALLMIGWSPLGGVIWQATDPVVANLLVGLYLASWGLLLYVTFLINHFDLFGLRQSWYALKDKPMPALTFVTPTLYRLVRHPLYVAWLGIMWFTPTMTISHFIFALGGTTYILIGIKLEERDLVNMHPEYADYMEKVPALVPRPGKRLRKPTVSDAA